MDDLISRKAAIDALRKAEPLTRAFGYHHVIDSIRELPSAQSERVEGEWLMLPDPYGFFDEIPVCSECGCTTKMREKYKYCPNCGVKMKERQEE